MPFEYRVPRVRPSNPRVGASTNCAFRIRLASVALALSGCGASAQSDGVPEDQAPQAEPAPPTEPAAMEPSDTAMPLQCVGVVDSTGTLHIDVRDQRGLDALAGCSTIVGNLTIQAFDAVDLRPLASLEAVQGTLTLGSLYDVPPANGFPSLEGLDNLEAVAGLSLRGVVAPSLLPLGSLSHFVPFADGASASRPGHVFVDHCPELTDLSGLERLTGLRALSVMNNVKLTSLRGLQIPEMLDGLSVSDSPVEDLGDMSRLTEVRGTLWFNHTALQSAAGLERVARVDQLQFWGNSALRDLSALSALTALTYLNVTENPQLETLPNLDSLRQLTGLVVTNNAALREIPHIPVSTLREGFIENNASLTHLLALSEADDVYQLRVADNPQLGVFDLGQLREVTELWVTNNPAFDDTALERLKGLEYASVRIAGNLGETLPLADCPWTGDGICDEIAYGVCAKGTDPDCIATEQ